MMDTIIHDHGQDEACWVNMADYESLRYSKRQIVEAGKALVGTISAADEAAIEIFRIAHNWRTAHALPMMRIREDARSKARKLQTGIVTAARLKRMDSIRRKIRRAPLTLYQLQDIGGCRVVLDSVENVNHLIELYRAGDTRHKVHRVDDYINNPKPDGYRSSHIVFKFKGEGEEEIYNRQHIELQIRTKLQHAWATAVEAVGLVRHENLKNGDGDADWLRFFQIASSEFAILEKCPVCPGVSEDDKERRDEFRKLNRKLGAVTKLESYNQVIRYTEKSARATQPGGPRYYVLQYNHTENHVTVHPSIAVGAGAAEIIEEERLHGSRNTVLVEVDKVADLRAAFPNYFLDVTMFADQVRQILAMPTRPVIATTPSSERFAWVRPMMRPKNPKKK